MEDLIVNRVANSSLITLDLEDYYLPGERIFFDLAPWLFQGLLLKEKELREHIKTHDWAQYQRKHVAIGCTEDAIVPVWAYMLIATKLAPFAASTYFGTVEQMNVHLFETQLMNLDFASFQDQKVIVKGCSKVEVPTQAYIYLATKLQPYVSNLMYGEACSNVPLYKKPKQ